jgi:hypothetical protein
VRPSPSPPRAVNTLPGRTLPPPVTPARWHFRAPKLGSSSCRVPQFRSEVYSQPVVACCTPGVCWDNPHLMMKKMRHHTLTILVKCLNRFHLSQVTTLQTQAPLVNIGRRGSSILLWSAPDVRYIVRGLRTSSSAAAQRTPLPPYIVIQM